MRSRKGPDSLPRLAIFKIELAVVDLVFNGLLRVSLIEIQANSARLS